MGLGITKRFMEEHGKRKKSMKVNWATYVKILSAEQGKGDKKKIKSN